MTEKQSRVILTTAVGLAAVAVMVALAVASAARDGADGPPAPAPDRWTIPYAPLERERLREVSRLPGLELRVAEQPSEQPLQTAGRPAAMERPGAVEVAATAAAFGVAGAWVGASAGAKMGIAAGGAAVVGTWPLAAAGLALGTVFGVAASGWWPEITDGVQAAVDGIKERLPGGDYSAVVDHWSGRGSEEGQ